MIEINKKPRHEKMNTERFHYCDSNEDSFLDINEFEDYLFPHKSFKNPHKNSKPRMCDS